jgi:rhomboid protease GluP
VSDQPTSTICPSCGSLVGIKDEKCYVCGRPQPGLFGLTPVLRGLGGDLGFLQIVVGGCGILYLASLALTARLTPDALQGGGGALGFLAPSTPALFLLGASGAVPVYGMGRWWTVLSACWLHGGLLHIAFNMMSARNLIPAMAEIYGPGRTVLLWTIGGISGFVASSTAGAFFPNIPFLHGAGFTIGASASIFGFIGALLHYGNRMSSTIRTQALNWAVSGLVMGFVFQGIDNWAHIGGFIGGYLASSWLNPLLPERGDHMVAAAVCLVLSLASVAASVLTGLKHLG